jgi:hypothetical protein
MRTLILCLLVASLAPAQQGKPTSLSKETEYRKAIASALVEFASWCQSKKLIEEGRKLNDEALGLDPDNAKAKALKDKLSGASDAGEADRREYEKKLEGTGKKAASLYVRLFYEKRQVADQPRFDGYLLRGLELDAKGAGPVVDGEAKDAYSHKDWSRAIRLLAALEKEKSDPGRAKMLREVELRGAETSAILRKASSHEMQYYLSLPRGWNPGRKWPIGVGLEGAGCGWLGMLNSLMGVRGDKPFILVTPITFSNTNALDRNKYPYPPSLLDEVEKSGRLKFDEEGLLAVLEDLRKEFAGDEKVAITGFSGGGLLCWRMTFGHPDMLLASAPACANFYNAGEISKDPARETLPIHAFQGDKDEYLHNPPNLAIQWENAKKLLDENGFRNVKYDLVAGVGHSNFPKEVMDHWAAALRTPAKK